MRFLLALLPSALLAATAMAQGVTVADLQGVTIQTTNTYAGTFKGEKGIAPGKATLRGDISIGANGAITYNFTRSVALETPVGTKTGSLVRRNSGTIGAPHKASDGTGDVIWIFENDSLVQMRTVRSGGHLHKIVLSRAGTDWKCASDRALMREVGAGNIKDRGAVSPEMEILDVRHTGSSCRVTKP